MPPVAEEHPRSTSLKIREALVRGFHAGLVAEAGLMAHGRGEALDYLLGEESRVFALEAEKVATAALLIAAHPILSVNGNTAALVAAEMVQLAQVTNAQIEINLFHRSVEREERIRDWLLDHGAESTSILGVGETARTELPGIASDRRMVAEEGIAQADCLLVPLEDGDRTGALRQLGKTVIAIDLNPLSRTAQWASITIVDNVVRAIPQMCALGTTLATWAPEKLKRLVEFYDNRATLKKAIAALEARLVALADVGYYLEGTTPR